MADVAANIADEYGSDLHCIYSDDNADRLVLRIRIRSGGARAGGEDPTQAVTFDDGNQDDDEWQFLRRVEGNILAELKLRGVDRVTKVYIKKSKMTAWDPATGKLGGDEEWVLETDGTNLAAILGDPAVDHTRTCSNDIVEICEVMGIEGTRQALLMMLREVISFDGAYVNYRHLAILCDTMCFRGSLMAISRHGINRGDSGPLLSASFEETVEILFKSAVYARNDDVDGVTPNIMLGQLAHVGSGVCDLLLDTSQLKHAVELEAPEAVQGSYRPDAEGAGAAAGAFGANGDGFGAASPAHTPYAASPSGMYGGAISLYGGILTMMNSTIVNSAR